MVRQPSCSPHPKQNGKNAGKLSMKSWRASLRLAQKHWSLNDLPHDIARFCNPTFGTLPRCTAGEYADLHAEADGEDGGVGLLRRKGGAGVARQVGRYGGNSDADHEQSEAA